MNPHLLVLLQSPLVQIALGSTAILTLALLFAVTGIKGSAAERHRGLLCAFVALAFLPWAILWAPKQPIPVKVAAVKTATARTVPVHPSDSTSAPPVSPDPTPGPNIPVPSVSVLLGAFWAAGALLRLAHLGLGIASLRRLRLEARPFATHDGLPVLLSDSVRVPLLAGCLRPAILLPGEAASWAEGRRAAVLAHEAGHRRRGDHLVQPLIGLLQAFYWWQPLLWIAAARLRREREQACDDAVLASGAVLPSDYAATLLAVAREAHPAPRLPAVAMASAGSVEGRIRAILAPGLRRTPAGWVVTTGGLFGYLTLVFVLATSHLVAQTPKIDPNVPSIWVESQVVEIDLETYTAHREAIAASVEKGDAAALIAMKGANSLSAPRIRTPSGRRATLGMTRTFYFPTRFDPAIELRDAKGHVQTIPVTPTEFDHKEIGVTLDVFPSLSGKEIVLQGQLHLVNFVGFTRDKKKGPLTPSLVESSDSFYETMANGERIGRILPGANFAETPVWPKERDAADPDATAPESKKYVRFLFLSARVAKPEELAANP